MNDRVLVEVHNDLPSSGVTLHWHGLTMDEDPYMDGVSGLTQCPIQPRQVFTYSFKANFPGTHYWHAQEGICGNRYESLTLIIPRYNIIVKTYFNKSFQ